MPLHMPNDIATKASLVAHWRLGTQGMRNGGIVVGTTAAVTRAVNEFVPVPQGALTIGGGAALSTLDKLAASTVFSGSAGDYLQVAHSSALALTGDMTIVAIINPTSFANHRGLLGKQITLAAPYRWYLNTGDGKPQFLVGNDATEGGAAGTTAPTAGVASILGVTMSGTTCTHYLNGAANNSGSVGAQARVDSGGTLRIGAQATGFPLLGSMQDVALFSAALTATEMLALAVESGFA